MKKFLLYTFLLALLFTAGLFAFSYKQGLANKELQSPVPDFLDSKKNSQVSTLDLWIPFLGNILVGDEKPDITAKSALVYDLTTDKVLYEKKPKVKHPMASITKLMTAVIALDHRRADNSYLVTEDDLVGENVMGLSAGERFKLEELLLGVFMYSGNDAAETIATNTMPRDVFIKAMNDKAKSLGMEKTNFTNPTGLEGDGDQHTTAYDLLVLSKYAVSHYPEIVKASSTAEKHLPETNDHYAYDMYNQLNLVTTYPGVKGLKDGYTPEAGLCLITYLEYEDHKIIAIILGSENRRAEMKDLLDYSLKSQGIKPPEHD